MLAAAGVRASAAYESIQYPTQLRALASLPAGSRLDLAGVGISVIPGDAPPPEGTEDWPVITEGHGFTIRSNPDVTADILTGTGEPPDHPADLPAFLSSASQVAPSLRTMNRLSLVLPENTNWLRISQNWHEGWRWKTPSGEWRPFLKGSDNSCWINHVPAGLRSMEVRFFPRNASLPAISLLSACGCALMLMLSLRKPRPSNSL
jgi:hypothetical protein